MKSRFRQHAGLTLVELLVAIAILAIVVALIVPRLRLVSKDRNIREAARVAGSVFSSARDRAIAEGSAGVIIERKPEFRLLPRRPDNRFIMPARVCFKCVRMPPYVGDSLRRSGYDSADHRHQWQSRLKFRAIIPLPLE